MYSFDTNGKTRHFFRKVTKKEIDYNYMHQLTRLTGRNFVIYMKNISFVINIFTTTTYDQHFHNGYNSLGTKLN